MILLAMILRCDLCANCSTTYVTTDRVEVRRLAADDGWTWHGGNDRCPSCTADRAR